MFFGVHSRAVTMSPGVRVGPYEIIEPLGSGGMGRVFRARDARLKRDVALKILSIASGDHGEYRARFEREAQVLASLNDPRIAQVYGVEEYQGAPVIAMELVEGPTLAERIGRGPLALDDALQIAAQICDGLEAAHERGIVHRDLKPANIKIRPGDGAGAVVILDFGLARALDAGAPDDPANSPTMMGGATAVGVVMGTAAYMSPEQARARVVDKRADVWAFGCVLYEMLSGAQAFAGESTTDILAGVVQNDPDWTKLPANVPPQIVHLVQRCLQKNPKDRLRDIGDARYEIESASRGPKGLRHDEAPGHTQPERPAEASRYPARYMGNVVAFFGGVALAAAAAAAIVSTVARKGEVAPDTPVRSTIVLPANTTLALSRGSAIALSPDGKRLVFAGRADRKTRLYIRSLDKYDAQPIAGTDDAQSPFFSTDGRWVGFYAEQKLKKVALDGGAPVPLADARALRGEVWSHDDTLFVTPSNADPVMRLSALGGKPVPVSAIAEGEMSHRWPRVLPNGKAILFAIWNDNGWEPSRIAAQRLDSQTHTIVVESGAGYPHYIRDSAADRGFLVYARSEGLLAARFDEAKLTLTGQPVPVVDSVVTNLSGGAHFDLSPSGTLAYVPGTTGEAARELVWVALDGKAEPLAAVQVPGRWFRLSPDGTQIVHNNAVTANGGVWMKHIPDGAPQRFSAEADDYAPIWAKDGTFVVYGRGPRSTGLFLRRTSTGADEVQLTSSMLQQQPSDISPDGRTLAYTTFDPVSAADIWMMPTAGALRAEPRAFVQTKSSEGGATFSPDGRWVAYQSNESGRFEVYARSFPDGARTIQLTTNGGLAPQWSPDGRGLFYYGNNGSMMLLPLETATTASDLRMGKARALFDASGYETIFNVAPDGRRILMMPVLKSEQAGTQIQLVTNFLSELRHRVR